MIKVGLPGNHIDIKGAHQLPLSLEDTHCDQPRATMFFEGQELEEQRHLLERIQDEVIFCGDASVVFRDESLPDIVFLLRFNPKLPLCLTVVEKLQFTFN